MVEPGRLAEILLEQSPACHCVVRAARLQVRRSKGPAIYGEIAFERVWGDSVPLFGKPSPELTGAVCGAVLSEEKSRSWSSRFERAFDGDSLLLRERHGKSIWYVSVFPIRLDGDHCYAGGIGREITPWGVAEQELRQTVLSALKAQEFERTMMARFLHDSVGQNLTALGLQLDLIRMDLETAAPAVGARVAEVQKVLGEMMESVREYSYELNPATVERAGLRAALDRLAVRARERFAGVFRVNVDPSMKIEPKLASAFYQIAQEAVENAIQHSGGSAIDITLRATRTGIGIEVRDNGRGFDPDDILGSYRGLGLLSMEHYAAEAGLEFSIASTREMGTTVRATTG
jgi:signal transduction histidine kinase